MFKFGLFFEGLSEETHIGFSQIFRVDNLHIKFIFVSDCGAGEDHGDVDGVRIDIDLRVSGIDRLSKTTEFVGGEEVEDGMAQLFIIESSLMVRIAIERFSFI